MFSGLGKRNQRVRWLAGLTLAVALPSFGGDPIIVGSEKPKQDPARENKFNKDLFKSWEKTPGAPLDGLVLPTLPRPIEIDPRKQRKAKLQDLEKRNWMSVRPGELQDEEEAKNFLGVKQYELEKEEESDNLMFRDLEKKAKNSAQGANSSQNRIPGQKPEQDEPRPQQRMDTEELERELEARRNAKSQGDSGFGSHTASELNLKEFFGAGTPASGEASSFSLKELLGKASTQPSKEQQQLREEFKAFLQGKQATATTPVAGPSDPINSWRIDPTRQPLNPVIAKPSEPALKNDLFAPPQSFNRQPGTVADPFARVPAAGALPGVPGQPFNSGFAPPPRQAPLPSAQDQMSRNNRFGR